MSIFEFDREKYERMMKEEYREEGREEGREQGRKEGREEGREEKSRQIVYHMFDKDYSTDEVCDLTGQPADYVGRLHEEYIQMVRETGNYRVDTDKEKEC